MTRRRKIENSKFYAINYRYCTTFRHFFGLDRNIACLLRGKCAPSYAPTNSNFIGAPLSYFDEMSAVHIVNLLALLSWVSIAFEKVQVTRPYNVCWGRLSVPDSSLRSSNFLRYSSVGSWKEVEVFVLNNLNWKIPSRWWSERCLVSCLKRLNELVMYLKVISVELNGPKVKLTLNC